MKKKKLEKIEFVLLLIVIFQIFLLINMSAANSYMIHQTDNSIKSSQIDRERNKFKNLINSGFTLLTGFLSIKQIGIVSAQEDAEAYCCPNTCDLITSTSTEGCPDNVEPIKISCDSIPDCILGCCYDLVGGLCTTNSPKGKCINDGGEWNEDYSCSINNCVKGCCVLGSEPKFTTEGNCEFLSDSQGYAKDFRDISNEPDCLALSATQSKGACITGGVCRFRTEDSCLSNGGMPYVGYLCSYPGLNTGCNATDYIGCVGGEAEIYWFDSCGNRENIYDIDKEASWNNGRVLSKENSCGSDGNVGSTTCGNCASPLSECSETEITETSVSDGDFICKDLSCKDAPANVDTQDRINGEKWCLYDGFIGDGKDTVGSEHWIAYCFEGEVEVDKCGDYRGNICAEQTIEENNKKFSMASCVVNQASYCIIGEDGKKYNPLRDEDGDNEENIQNCKDNKHCMIKRVDIDDYFKFDMCVPRYSKGAGLRDEGLDDNLCKSLGSPTCDVHYKKNFWGVWKCQENCDCEKNEFAEKMNDLCISLGDCGSYINYIGVGTDNSIPKVSWTTYQSYANPVTGQHVEPQDIDEFLTQLFGSGGDYNLEEFTSQAIKYSGTISGALGVLAAGIAWVSKIWTGATTISAAAATPVAVGAIITIGQITTALGSIAIGLGVGIALAKLLGLENEGAVLMIISGGIAGIGVAFLILVGLETSWGLIGWGLIIVGIILGVWAWLTGWGETEIRKTKFTCMSWQAPTFDNFADAQSNCEMCNGDALRPCTKYRCDSLGQTCKILNENEENPSCDSLEYEPNPAVISPGEVLTLNYAFQNSQTKSVEIISDRTDECIEEFTSVYFTLGTDEPAACKYSFKTPPPTYEEMDDNYPFEQGAYTEKHTFEIWMPSLDSLDAYDAEDVVYNVEEVYGVDGDAIGITGNMNMHVRCKDYWKNFNIDPYVVKFCINSGNDGTAVNHALTVTDPKNPEILKYGTSEIDLTMWINEPAECRYDTIPNQDYEIMKNNMECETGVGDKGFRGWPCSTTLTNLANDINKFYIRCKDKPWVDTEEEIEEYGERNVNQEDYEYVLDISESELKIDSVSFSTTFSDQTITILSGETFTIGGISYISVDMEVETSGGISNGESICFWGVLEDGNRYPFYNTFSNIHTQLLTPRLEGTHINYIECEDDIENKANATAQFIISIDSDSPKVTRAYHKNGKLNLITDEDAECYYNLNGCIFDIDDANDATKFDSVGYSTKHSTDWIIEQTYYIKCKDVWDNQNTDCAIRVIPSRSFEI